MGEPLPVAPGRLSEMVPVTRMPAGAGRRNLALLEEGRRLVELGAGAGGTEAEAARAAVEVVVVVAAAGAVLYDAACASGPRSHQFTWARLPSHDGVRALEPGDLFHVDCYGAYGGYFWDFGRTAGEVTDDGFEVLTTCPSRWWPR